VEKEWVSFRGTQVIRGWPEKIRRAQLLTTCRLNGQDLDRIPYGSEAADGSANERACHDCGVIQGELHVPGCDVEVCPACGGQRINCECERPGSGRPASKHQAVKPFSKQQLKVVAARQQFSWRHTGFALNGDATFEVFNGSPMRLPYLSIGVQGRGGSKLVGGAWLNVASIEPGTRGAVQHDCYKDQLLPEEVECFAKADPTPETKDRYWEFKRLQKPDAPSA
jgi:hypothetical protein